ncbi:PBP1A family penicillin-binding protein [Peribacillus sp. NPDC097224]|uniref:PBP1A family penicillin-binding protein n=1 Tax=Peribacillus sp. NPDC097224 TaxID=3364399 RepID=UPI0037F510A6
MAEKYNTREERRKQGQAQKKAPKKGPKKPTNMLKRVFLILVTIGIICLVAGGATLAYFISDAPKLDESLLKDPVTSKILDEEGKLLGEVGTENRDFVNYEDIPELVEDAFLATEDSRFYSHHGVDFLRLGSAVLANVKNGFGSEGASTLTQQVIKRSYLTPDKTIKRKVQEMWLAIQLERKYTKQEILEMYVNKIFFANRANGILTASQTYYGKDLDKLDLNEVAMLVGLPQSPSRYDPYKYPERAKERRDIVLHLMNKHGYISEQEMKKAQNVKITAGLQEVDKNQIDTTAYDAFIDLVIEEVGNMGDYNVFTDGLEIQTTIDKDAQEYVYKMLNSNDIVSYPSEDLQAGVTLLDTQTGEIKAVGGGRNTNVKRGWNYATDAKRSPGSTIKPILDYGPAVEYLNWSTYQPIKDEEYTYFDGTPLKNASGTHYGTVPIREALARSLNIPALKAFQEVGKERARDFAIDLGVPFDKDKEINESASIGGGTDVSTLELAGAYGAFGNGGIYNEPHTVKKIVLRDKTTIKNKTETKPVMKDSTAFIVTDMLKSVMTESYGTGRLANIPGLPVAGKTGSTNFTPAQRAANNIPASGVKDSWMAGYTTNYTVAIWAGYDNNAGKKMEYLGDSSQRIPKYIFKNLMEHMAQSKTTKDFEQPSSVAKVGVIKGSNPVVKANQYTPSDKISYEYYVKGHEPTQVTTEYEKIDTPSVSASYNQESNEIQLSWSHSDGDPQFEVQMSVDGGSKSVLKKSKDTSLTIPNPTPGSKYTFSVVAIVDNQRSDPAGATVQIPSAIEEKPEEEEDIEEPAEDEDLEQDTPTEDEGNEDEDKDKNPDQGNTDNNGNNGNGNGNGNDDATKDDEDVEDEDPGKVDEDKPADTPEPAPAPDPEKDKNKNKDKDKENGN